MSKEHIHHKKVPGRLVFSRTPLSVAFIPANQLNLTPEKLIVQYISLADYLSVVQCSERDFFRFFEDQPFRILEGIIPFQQLLDLGINLKPGESHSMFITYIVKHSS